MMTLTNQEIKSLLLVMEKGDGVEALLWPRSTVLYRGDKLVKGKNMSVLEGNSGPLKNKTLVLDIGNNDTLITTLKNTPIASGAVYLCESTEKSQCENTKYIGKSIIYLEKYYDPKVGILPPYNPIDVSEYGL